MALREEVLLAISAERDRQIAKWGPQHHPDGTGSPHFKELEEHWKNYNDKYPQDSPNLYWKGILLEEVYEALSEGRAEDLIKELVQVAAVAVAWIEDIKGRANE